MPKLNARGDLPRSYRAGESLVPAVTSVLSVLDGEWMNAFLQRAGRKEAQKVLGEAAALGTKVHAVAERVARERKWRPKDKEMRPYARAVREFLDAHVREVLATELSLSSERLGFGGTIDLVAEMTDGSVAVIDYKTSSGGVTKIHKLQTCAYAMLAGEAGYRITRRVVVRLKKGEGAGEWYARGAYDHHGDAETFRACLTVWRFLHGSKLEKAA